MIWYILLAIVVYLTLVILVPVLLYKMGVISSKAITEGFAVFVGIFWPVSLLIACFMVFTKAIFRLIKQFANVKNVKP